MQSIHQAFQRENVVIVRAASGQGKTTLAYRYLLNWSPTQFRYKIERAADLQHARWMAAAIAGHAEVINVPPVIYVDVRPGDNLWVEFVRALAGVSDIRVLVTIREEDWFRSRVTKDDFDFVNLSLPFDQNTAERLFTELRASGYGDAHLNFEDAWSQLGDRKTIQSLPLEKRRAWLYWMRKYGPHWEECRQHSDDDWLESNGDPLFTGRAIGEAAFCCMHGLDREVVSADPSDWLYSPIPVTWRKSETDLRAVDVANRWTVESITDSLRSIKVRFHSWHSLEVGLRKSCDMLTFADDAFAPLFGRPFVQGAAERIQILLGVLNTLRGCFDENGHRTEDGNRIIEEHFSGGKAWFTDSSASEKREFESEMTFPHPLRTGEYLFCPWHGKIKTPQMRIHFSFPVSVSEPLFIVYVGPKITMQ
jgi:hypothetical protein